MFDGVGQRLARFYAISVILYAFAAQSASLAAYYVTRERSWRRHGGFQCGSPLVTLSPAHTNSTELRFMSRPQLFWGAAKPPDQLVEKQVLLTHNPTADCQEHVMLHYELRTN